LAGFFGKFYVFTAALDGGPDRLVLLWLVVVAIAMSAVSLYYYLQVLKQIFVANGPADPPRFVAPAITQTVMVILALLVVFLGCAPDWLLGPLSAAIKQVGLR
jgi:NADH-quinone oxidoreductase subunit N